MGARRKIRKLRRKMEALDLQVGQLRGGRGISKLSAEELDGFIERIETALDGIKVAIEEGLEGVAQAVENRDDLDEEDEDEDEDEEEGESDEDEEEGEDAPASDKTENRERRGPSRREARV